MIVVLSYDENFAVTNWVEDHSEWYVVIVRPGWVVNRRWVPLAVVRYLKGEPHAAASIAGRGIHHSGSAVDLRFCCTQQLGGPAIEAPGEGWLECDPGRADPRFPDEVAGCCCSL